MDRGAWWATVHGVAKSQTRLKQPSTHTEVQRDGLSQVNFLPVSAFCAYGAGASCLRQAADEPPSRLQSRSKSLIEVDFSIPSYRPLHSSMSTFRRTVPKVIFSFFLFGHLSIPLLPSLSGWHSAQTVKGIQLGCRPHPCRLPWKD